VFFAVGFWPVRTGGCQPIETSGRIAAVGYEPILCSHDVANSGRLGVPHFWYLWLNCQTTVTFNSTGEIIERKSCLLFAYVLVRRAVLVSSGMASTCSSGREYL
jgi:hypothetical protein